MTDTEKTIPPTVLIEEPTVTQLKPISPILPPTPTPDYFEHSYQLLVEIKADLTGPEGRFARVEATVGELALLEQKRSRSERINWRSVRRQLALMNGRLDEFTTELGEVREELDDISDRLKAVEDQIEEMRATEESAQAQESTGDGS